MMRFIQGSFLVVTLAVLGWHGWLLQDTRERLADAESAAKLTRHRLVGAQHRVEALENWANLASFEREEIRKTIDAAKESGRLPGVTYRYSLPCD